MELDSARNKTNPILVAQSISKLVTDIKKDPQGSSAKIKFLKDKCITSEDAAISLAAANGIIILAECDILQTTSTLSEFVSSLTLARCCTGVTSAICGLLFVNVRCKASRKAKSEEDAYDECQYNLRAPQHPLISIYIRSPESAFDILTKVKFFYTTDCYDIVFYTNEVLFPFYMYILCNPTTDVPDNIFYEFWNFLISIKNPQSVNVIFYAIAWLQTATQKQIVRASKVLMTSIDVYLESGDDSLLVVLVLWLTSLISQLIYLELDPQGIIAYLMNTMKRLENSKIIASCILTMLADCIPICPSSYLEDLLTLCYEVLQLGFSNKFNLYSLKASLLQWIAYGCLLTNHSLKVANQILVYIENHDGASTPHTSVLCQNPIFHHLKNTNLCVHTATELNILAELLPPSEILHWLNRIEKAPINLIKHFFNYFTALLLHEVSDPCITLKVIEILLKISDQFKETTTQLLILFLYKISNETDSRTHFALLKALPKMAILKENLPLVLNMLELIRKGMFGLKSFVLTLYFDLWNVNEMCYVHLLSVLVDHDKVGHGGLLWDFYVTKAYIINEICKKRPEVHGKELVAHLSEILNKCTNKNGGVATSLAIEAIKALCKAQIFGVNSAWNELSPQFKAESRVIVLKSLCNFMTEVSCSESSECSVLVTDDILKTLWEYATSSQNPDIVSAAFGSLGSFTLEQVSQQFPDKFKVVLPKSHDIVSFNLIPGRYWINLLLNVQEVALNPLGDLLIKLTSAEISTYRNSTYYVAEGQKEPSNLNYLPEHSVIRALENYVRSQVGNWLKSPTKSVYVQCLRILSQEFNKPLPPADWCFLQELVHVPESRFYSISLASHQVQVSGTARRLVENFITALCNMTLKDEDIELIYTNMKYLSNSIQPMNLRPFIESSVKYGLARIENDNMIKVFGTIILHLRNTLSDENIHEANRLMLSQIIVNTVHKVDMNSEVFIKLLECVTVLPIRYIDELSSPRLWKEPTEQQIVMSIQIRCNLALKATISPLTWLNDILDVQHLGPSHHKFFLTKLIQIMETHRSSDFASSWTMELLGNIQSTLAKKFMTQNHLKFLCDVFILSVVVLAGQDLFINKVDELVTDVQLRLRMLPQSIARLVKFQHWKLYTAQITEWLYHMICNNLSPKEYKQAFFELLAALKHEDVFQKSSKWMTYVGVSVPLNI